MFGIFYWSQGCWWTWQQVKDLLVQVVMDVIKRSYVESYFDAWGAKFGYTWNFIMSRTQEV